MTYLLDGWQSLRLSVYSFQSLNVHMYDPWHHLVETSHMIVVHTALCTHLITSQHKVNTLRITQPNAWSFEVPKYFAGPETGFSLGYP